MAKASAHISLIVPVRSTRLVFYKTLRSLDACIKHANKSGLTIESNFIYERNDHELADTINDFIARHKNAHLFTYEDAQSTTKFMDVGNGEFVMVCNSSGLLTKNFLKEAYELARGKNDESAYIASYTISFDGAHELKCNTGTNDKSFSVCSIYDHAYYDGDLLIPGSVYQRISSLENISARALTSEWLVMELVARGYTIRTVPDTIYFDRCENAGIAQAHDILGAKTITDSHLFEPGVFRKLDVSTAYASPGTMTKHNEVTSIHSGGLRLKDKLKAHPKLFNYAKAQYHLHGSIYSEIQQKFKKFYFHTRNREASLTEDMATINNAIPNRLRTIGIDKSVIELWGEVNYIEPMVRSSWDMLMYIPIVSHDEDSYSARLYHHFCEAYYQSNIGDVVLVPHLVHGGADLAAINLINELSQKDNVLVIITLDVESPWINKIRGKDNVICLESRIDFVGMNEPERIDLIVKIIRYWNVKRLSIINSEVGYKIAQRYDSLLRDIGCKTFLHTYAFDMTEDGFLFNYIPDGLVKAYSGVDVYVTDSLGYKYQLEEINGFEPEKVFNLYLPTTSSIRPKNDYGVKHKVLWASRVHTAKLIEVAVEIGRRLGGEGIELHMFGAIDDEYARNDRFQRMIEGEKGIVYHGAYDGFGSLDTNEYDIFLLTSKNEGMPNVILEAVMANIYIVAPEVGGIPETIKSGVNGTLVTNKFSPEAYVEAIKDAYTNKLFSDTSSMRKQNATILDRHSRDHYSNDIKRLMLV